MSEIPSFIDVEASGLTGRSYPIEVGVVMPHGEMYCALVRPDPQWVHWDEAAEAVHRISRAILGAHGKPLAMVARHLNDLLENQVVYSDAWGNDLAWLGKLFDAADLPMRFRLESSRKLLDDAQAARWAEVKAQVTAELNLTRHRASTDARILQLTLARIRGDAA
ncbi:MAG: hypothetical protein JNM90_08280 [Burkholderiales bacterium]|nr:hypothetical protein [Burkholderiales bacterium]